MRIAKMQKHSSGQWRVRINGACHYLGKDKDSAERKYRELITEHYGIATNNQFRGNCTTVKELLDQYIAEKLRTDLISLSQAAKLLPPRHGKRVHTATVYRWGKQGRLTLYQCNGLRVSETELRSRFKVRLAFGTAQNPTPSSGKTLCRKGGAEC